jgi:hypothetical protein
MNLYVLLFYNTALILSLLLYIKRLIVRVSDFGLLIVTAIIWVVGLVMFLLPPIPGVPVYLTIGVVLPAQGHEMLGMY